MGSNAALAIGLVAIATGTLALVRFGWAPAASPERSRAARWADAVVTVTLAVGGAAALVAAVARAHRFANDTVRTAAFRAPLIGLAALVVAIALVAIGPGLVRLARRPLAAARPAVPVAVVIVGVLGWATAATLALRAVGPTLAELDPPFVLSLVSPGLALLAGMLAGGALARRLRGRVAALVAALLVLSFGGSLGLLGQRRVLRASVASSALTTRRLAVFVAAAASRTPAPPGPASRLVPRERVPVAKSIARHLVLVTIDALRYDRVFPRPGSETARRRLAPRLGAFAARGVRFDAAFCAVPGSLRALPALVTGRAQNALAWRRPRQVYLDAGQTRTLAEILAGAGFDTVYVPHTRYVMNPGMTQGFAKVIDPVLLPEADRKRKKPRDVPMVEATLQELERRRAEPQRSGERLFLWSHLVDPHAPYWDGGRFGSSQEDRYDGEAASSDRAFGMLLDGLQRLGILDDALVVVTADHGEEFGEHGSTRHSRTLWDAAVRVPLVFVAPGLRPRRIAEPVSHLDLVPTILPMLGVAAPRGLEGRSLVRTVREGARPPARTIILVAYPMYDRFPALYAAVRGDHKLLTDRDGVATGLYDWRHDPLEKDNLLDDAPTAEVRALEADVSRYRTRGLGAATR